MEVETVDAGVGQGSKIGALDCQGSKEEGETLGLGELDHVHNVGYQSYKKS